MSNANTDDKFKNSQNNYLPFNGAMVLWPPDCPDNILKDAIELVKRNTRDQSDTEGAKLAEVLRMEIEEKHQPHWHVVCGKNFGCYAIHEMRRFIFFYYNNSAYLFYKAG
jgi:dynein light chain LC8-type